MSSKVFDDYQGSSIKIDGQCYKFSGETTKPRNAFPFEIEGTFDSCLACELASSSSESLLSESSESFGGGSSSSESLAAPSSSSSIECVNVTIGGISEVKNTLWFSPPTLFGNISEGTVCINGFDEGTYTNWGSEDAIVLATPGAYLNYTEGEVIEVCEGGCNSSESSSSYSESSYSESSSSYSESSYSESSSSYSESSYSESSSSGLPPDSSSSSSESDGPPLPKIMCGGNSDPRMKVTLCWTGTANSINWLHDGTGFVSWYNGESKIICPGTYSNSPAESWNNTYNGSMQLRIGGSYSTFQKVACYLRSNIYHHVWINLGTNSQYNNRISAGVYVGTLTSTTVIPNSSFTFVTFDASSLGSYGNLTIKWDALQANGVGTDTWAGWKGAPSYVPTVGNETCP